jgi:predicted Holliday junction resolvase-like endonuclease
MDKLEIESERLDGVEERISEKEEALREKAREKGRREAIKIIKKVDRVFTPRRLNPDDAKVIFHPIDYIVFNGMKNSETMKNIVLLDRESKSSQHRAVQKSIERVLSRGDYEWLTLRVQEDGSIVEE